MPQQKGKCQSQWLRNYKNSLHNKSIKSTKEGLLYQSSLPVGVGAPITRGGRQGTVHTAINRVSLLLCQI